ncbi:MAG: hypothetical protein K2M71_04595 [Duncaniella sp.]|nr:hypothetical protein [Bacteroides sp.]MDE5827913.1 hypothetical protein [Duncaniella sp.]MBD5318683.1 hypothetical protein [Bacteroides sp.]MDE6429857.1 hypothetical protein [Duncaniella sp.]MDE6813579.1 hypothetical protein [Duncaniella sp.]
MSNNTKALPHDKPEWKGYTLDELRYMRAYTMARLEINKEHLQHNVVSMKDYSPVSKSGMLGKLLGTLSYIDIALLTYRIGSRAFKTVRFFRKKR